MMSVGLGDGITTYRISMPLSVSTAAGTVKGIASGPTDTGGSDSNVQSRALEHCACSSSILLFIHCILPPTPHNLITRTIKNIKGSTILFVWRRRMHATSGFENSLGRRWEGEQLCYPSAP